MDGETFVLASFGDWSDLSECSIGFRLWSDGRIQLFKNGQEVEPDAA